MNHVLSFEAPDTLNACILRLVDTSVYANIPVVCPVVAITLPGFTYSTEIAVEEGFSLNVTACDLGIQTLNCGSSYVDLPDGVYILKYSVSPASVVYVEYNHLRMSKVLQTYKKILCAIEVAGCDPPAEVKEKLKKVRILKDMLDAAKAKVEWCHNPKQGMQIFTYVCKEFDKIACTLCV
jgi:uncharacterized secreted protein with C-terminal beta-propeller domain